MNISHYSTKTNPRFLTPNFLLETVRASRSRGLNVLTLSRMSHSSMSSSILKRKKWAPFKANPQQTVHLSASSYQKRFYFTSLATRALKDLPPSDESGSKSLPIDEQLKHLATALGLSPSLHPSGTLADLKEQCFEAAYAICQNGEWNKLHPLADQLASLANHSGCTLLMQAVQDQNETIVEELIKLKIGLTKKDYEGNTPLHYAVKKSNNIAMIALLCEQFALEERNHLGQTPLHTAIEANQKENILILKQKGANLKAPFKSRDPLALCISHSAKDCFDLLFTEEEIKSQVEGGSYLHWAIQEGKSEMLSHLLRNYYSIKDLLESRDEKGRTPFSLAAYLGDEQAIEILYKQGADLNAHDLDGHTPLDWCIIGNQQSALMSLLNLKSRLEGQDSTEKFQQKARQVAIECGNQAMINFISEQVVGKRWDPQAQPPENLAFKGGGPKGIAYIGALQALEEREALSHLKRIAGTSAGAIFASLLSVGYTSREIQEILEEIDLKKFLDHPKDLDVDMQAIKEWALDLKQEIKAIQVQGSFPLFKRAFKACWSWWWMPDNRKNILKERWRSGGFCEGEYFRDLIEQKIADRVEKYKGTKINFLTFKELRELAQEENSPFKHLHVIAIRLGSEPEVKIFGSDNPACDEIIISDAVRASMSIPLAFVPHVLHKKGNGKRIAINSHELYVDGGLLMNYPLELFDRKKYQNGYVPMPELNASFDNSRTWGLNLYAVNKELKVKEQLSVNDVIKEVINVYTSAESLLRDKEKTSLRTIDIDNQGVGLFDFDLTPQQKKALFEAGKEATRQFLAKSKLTQIGKSKLHYNSYALLTKQRLGFFNLQEPHPSFVDRPLMMQRLESLLQPDRHTYQVICGPGGTGKSEMAIAYAYHHLEDYSLIWWINAENPQTEINDYRPLAKALKIQFTKPDEEVLLPELKESIYARLEQGEFERPWLLILDNSPTMPDKIPSKKGNVLITARPENIRNSHVLSIGSFDEDEALILLEKVTGEKRSPQMRELARQLHHFPLLLNCAGHYIRSKAKLSIANFLGQCKTTKHTPTQILSRENEPTERHPSLAMTYQMIFEDLTRHAYVVDCLKACAYLNTESIPIDFLDALLEGKVRPSERKNLRKEIIKILETYELKRPNQVTFSLHKLWQENIRIWQEQRQKTPHHTAFGDALIALNHYSSVSNYNATFEETIMPFRAVLPHCTSILESHELLVHYPRAAARLNLTVIRYFLDTARDLEQAAHYLRKTAVYAHYLPNAVKGRIHFYKGMLLIERAADLTPEKDKRRLYELASVYFKKALELYESDKKEENYKHLEQRAAKCHPTYQMGICLFYQAQILLELGKLGDLDKLGEANRLFDEANAKFKDIAGGKEHFDNARVMRAKAEILSIRGRKAEAEELLCKAIEMQERVYDTRFKSQPSVAKSYELLGDLCKEQYKWDDAIDAYEKAKGIHKNLYGKEFYINRLNEKIDSMEQHKSEKRSKNFA